MTSGLSINARHTGSMSSDPHFSVNWVLRNAQVGPFKQEGVSFPDFWSQNAVDITTEKYFRGQLGTNDRESSLSVVISRLSHWYTEVAIKDNYFSSVADADNFHKELYYILLHQRAAFNSPAWFNVGRTGSRPPRVSACFTLSVEDTMESILQWTYDEGLVFKSGSGAGVNLSRIRETGALLSEGGVASGPVSFMLSADASAGTIKSGGSTRRAAKMVILDVDHPDIEKYIHCKVYAEDVARTLKSAGYDVGINGKDSWLVPYQNANNSVGVSDAFMWACEEDKDWNLISRRDGSVAKTLKARNLLRQIATTAWKCACPGIQYLGNMNRWHTSPDTGILDTTNPCQPASATVLTPDGIKTFADIDAGSVIWSGKQWTTVIRKVPTGDKIVFRYKTRAGVFEGTANHYVFSNGERVQASEACGIDICKGASIGMPTIDPQDVLDGLICGDGYVKTCNGGNNHYLLLVIGAKDGDLLSEPGIKSLITTKPFEKLCHLVNTTFTKDELPKLPVRVIPDRFYLGNYNKVCGFLRGLYSANGSVCGGRVTLKTTSYRLVHQVQEMLSSIGISSYYTVNKKKKVQFANGVYECKESYDINITGKGKRTFFKKIGFIQKYKMAKLKDIYCKFGRPRKSTYEVVEVECLGKMPVFDITVDADEHSYWTGGVLVSNCSEFVRNNSSCNLASLRLTKYLNLTTGHFECDEFIHDVMIMITAMDASVSNAEYPTQKIRDNVHRYRELGLGYSDLGALLMSLGIPYDSDIGREWAAAITALMTGAAWLQSAKIAKEVGPYLGWDSEANRKAHKDVMQQHLTALHHQADDTNNVRAGDIFMIASNLWKEAIELGNVYGYRNAQISLLAPTGTISLLMDCDTTGIEPDFALVKVKKLSGGGHLKIVNQCVHKALKRLGYTDSQADAIVSYVHSTGDVVGAPGLSDYDLPVFACSVGDNAIDYMGHVKMMAAVQPFLCGAISKTVNMPSHTTVKDVEDLYLTAWRMGLKSIAIYRDGCKTDQPLNTKESPKKVEVTTTVPTRKKLPKHREGSTTSFRFSDCKGYLRTGEYADGKLGEIFLNVSRPSSTLGGIMDAFAIVVSIGLQHGVPLRFLVEKLMGHNFPPQGMTDDSELPMASSVIDYVARRLALDYLTEEERMSLGIFTAKEREDQLDDSETPVSNKAPGDNPICFVCGVIMAASGNCFVCRDCGRTSGCS